MYFFVNYYFDGFSPRPYLLLFPKKNVSTVGHATERKTIHIVIEHFVVATMPLFKVLDNLKTQKKAVMANTIQELITKGTIKFNVFFIAYSK